MSLSARKLLRNAAALVAAACACAFPAIASADASTFGSDLSAPATLIDNHGADTASWNSAYAGGGGQLVVPADGQITSARLKGGMLPNPDPSVAQYQTIASLFHFQVLRPQADGSLKVILSSGHMHLPVTTSPQDVVTTYGPNPNPYGSEPLVNLCVQRGDIIDFNTVGGHEYRRTPYNVNYQGAEIQLYGNVKGSQSRWYEASDKTNIGDTFPATAIRTVRDRELLMQTTLSTGPDASDICPGGYEQHIFRGLEVSPSPQDAIVRTRDRVAKVRTFCHGENYGGCHGTLTLTATIDGNKVELGSAPFDVPGAYTVNVQVPLSPDTILMLQRAGRLDVKAIADSHDDPGSDSRVKWGDAIPVQSKTTSGRVTLKPDKLLPTCSVPQVKGKSLAKAKRTLAKAGCPVGRITTAKGKKRGVVINQKPNRGSPLDAGTKVSLVIAR